MKHRYIFVLLLTIVPTFAGPAVDIQRGTTPATVAAAPPLATIVAGPFDDSGGALHDGLDYYYLVLDGGQALTLSVHKNLVLDTVRLGFDDSDAQSAPVDVAQSTVAASPPIVPADDSTYSTVVIEPRDSSGVLLGAGLKVTLDSYSMWPGEPSGPVLDLGSGRYEARITASVPGTGSVVVDVEGRVLNLQPQIVFQPVADLTLKELAILQIDDLSDIDGVFDDLVDGLDPDADPAKEILKAKQDALKVLDELYSGDPDADVEALEKQLKDALKHLERVLEDPDPLGAWEVEALIDHLLDAGRWVAEYWYEQAVEACGPCPSPLTDHICHADQKFIDGDDLRASETYNEASKEYAKVIEEALKSLADCAP